MISERVVAGFAGAHTHGAFDIQNKNLAVADLFSFGSACDRRNDLFRHAVGHDDFQPDLRNEVHSVFGTAIDFSVAGLGTQQKVMQVLKQKLLQYLLQLTTLYLMQ